MKKIIFTVTLIICVFFAGYGQNTSPADIVLLLDTSANMSSSYENVNDYLTGNFLSEFLRLGDTFHLIAFSGIPRLDVSRRIAGVGDVETIIGRILLQYPIERTSNLNDALNFTEQYISNLPARPKKIVLITIGNNDTSSIVNSARQRLETRNTTIDFIQVTPGQPLVNLPVSGRAPLTGTGAAILSGTGTTTTAPAEQHGTGASTGGTQSTGGTGASSGTTATGGTGTTGVADSTGGTGASSGTESAGGTESTGGTTPAQGSSTSGTRTQRETNETFASSLPLIIGLIILLLLILGLIIFFASRRLGSSPNRVMSEVASSSSASRKKPADNSRELEKFAAAQGKRTTPYDDRRVNDNGKTAINPTGPLLLNLFVEDQNTSIGKRNIHSLKSGNSLSVGGGASDFLIFLVGLPANIGTIRRKESQLSFIPNKPKYFPDIGSNEVKDCINKTIRIISDKGYEVRFRFEMYEDPLVALNQLLTSVKVPG